MNPRSGARIKASCAVASLGLLLAARSARAAGTTLNGSAGVGFSGASTLHGFQGKAPPVVFSVTDDEHGRWAGKVDVPAASLDSGNRWRDGNLRAMLDVKHYPVISAGVDGIDADAVRRSHSLPFTLTIRDRALTKSTALANWNESKQHLEFDAAFSVSLEEYGLEPPSALFMRVDDHVAVTVHVSLDRP